MTIPSQLSTGTAPTQRFRKNEHVHDIGLAADRPEANSVLDGSLYHSTDLGVTERSNGTDWETYFSAGLSSSVFFYRADLTSTNINGDPGAGKMRWNNSSQITATILGFDWLTDDGFDAHVLFQLFGPTTRFLMQDKGFALTYQIWELTSPAVNLSDFFNVPVSLVSSGGSGKFSNNQRVAVIILPPAASLVI